MARPFKASNAPGTCLWCGRRVPVVHHARATGEPVTYQRYGQFFDTLTCAYEFACCFAEQGRRLKPKEVPCDSPSASKT